MMHPFKPILLAGTKLNHPNYESTGGLGIGGGWLVGLGFLHTYILLYVHVCVHNTGVRQLAFLSDPAPSGPLSIPVTFA